MTRKTIFMASVLTVSVVINILLILLLKENQTRRNAIIRSFLSAFTNQKPPTWEALCYYHKFDSISRIHFIETPIGKAPILPGELVIAPGIYQVEGKHVDLTRQGLYRFMFPPRNNYQVIVYKDDLDVLLSSIAWIVSHGNSDNKLEVAGMIKKAKSDKLFLMCGPTTLFARTLLDSLGYKTRPTFGLTLKEKNNYNDEHEQFEIWHPSYNKWVLADIDNNMLFEDSTHQLLNLIEAKKSIDNNRVRFRYVANDAFVDISGFTRNDGYSYNFFSESLKSEETRKDWFRRVLEVVAVDGHFYDLRDTSEVKYRAPGLSYMDSTSFYKKFYNL